MAQMIQYTEQIIRNNLGIRVLLLRMHSCKQSCPTVSFSPPCPAKQQTALLEYRAALEPHLAAAIPREPANADTISLQRVYQIITCFYYSRWQDLCVFCSVLQAVSLTLGCRVT